jgi:uncharacterized protein (TIGR03032 family)
MIDDAGRFLQPVGPGPDEPAAISVSRGMAAWLLRHQVSLAYTSYQTGRLILAGVAPDGRLAFSEQNYARAMGLHYHAGTLYVASLFQIWKLRNLLRQGEYANNAHDCFLVPREAHTTGYVDTHELSVDGDGQVVFVNSRYSCLATLDDMFSFRPVWKPSFISALLPEDRCHLNGIAMQHGKPRYVTALGTADTADGWREAKAQGGVLIDVATDRVMASGLSMPHSPRTAGTDVLLLDSGRGNIVRLKSSGGEPEALAFCPGFLRGMVVIGAHAVVGVSKPRHDHFGDLPIARELERRGQEPWCGILVVDLRSGRIVEFIRYHSQIDEIFDVELLHGIRNPISIGPASEELLNTIRYDPDWP